MAERVTIQDIADALGVSRNTVSKAINNTGILADATREKVLKKAQEMGYKQFSYMALTDPARTSPSFPGPDDKREIALLTGSALGGSHIASVILDKFQRELTQAGYSLTLHRVYYEDQAAGRLSASFNPDRTAGIVCVEIFDHAYSHMICSQGIPTLFIDTPADGFERPLETDRLYMDNQTEIYRFISEMARRGRTRIGFIGEYLHCQSFYERYMAFRGAMFTLGLPIDERFCLTRTQEGLRHLDRDAYRAYLTEQLGGLDRMPDVFLCANDFVAIDVVTVLKRLGLSVPKDVWLCGFDDSPESRIMTPTLTTIHIHSQIMGFAAVQLLLSRIREPELNYRIMHTETELIYRESTEG